MVDPIGVFMQPIHILKSLSVISIKLCNSLSNIELLSNLRFFALCGVVVRTGATGAWHQ